MSQFHTVCSVGELPEGEARMFVVDETLIAVFHINGEFFALDDQCSHAGASLARGFVDGDVVTCRIHHWRFRIQDGAYLDEAKPCFNVKTYSVRVVCERVQVKV